MRRSPAFVVATLMLLAPTAWAAAGWDAGSWDAAGWDAGSWDAAGWDAGSWDAAGWDAGSWDAGSWDAGSWDAGSWDAGSWDAGSWDASSWDGGQWNGVPFALWGFAAIDVPPGWTPDRAPTSQLACIIDSGIDAAHPALAPYVAHQRSFIDHDMSDPGGHGTHIAGLVAATGAPQLAIAKVLDATGRGETADVVDALGWCTELQADVILLALTEDLPTKEFEKAVSRATKDAVVVASAGNVGPCEHCLSSPAELPQVLAVGAVDPRLAPASFSSAGPHLDLYAPGAIIASAFPGGSWRAASGTSQAAAFAAGAAAMLGAERPDWSAQQVMDALKKSAAPMEGEHAGLLDVEAALATRA